MNYEFTITMSGSGNNVNEAWNKCVMDLACDPRIPPEDYKLLNDNDEECHQHGEGNNKFFTDPMFWDCSCPDDKPYIHLKENGNYCPVCKSYEAEMPDSRVNEIKKKYDPKYDTAVKVEVVDENA